MGYLSLFRSSEIRLPHIIYANRVQIERDIDRSRDIERDRERETEE